MGDAMKTLLIGLFVLLSGCVTTPYYQRVMPTAKADGIIEVPYTIDRKATWLESRTECYKHAWTMEHGVTDECGYSPDGERWVVVCYTDEGCEHELSHLDAETDKHLGDKELWLNLNEQDRRRNGGL